MSLSRTTFRSSVSLATATAVLLTAPGAAFAAVHRDDPAGAERADSGQPSARPAAEVEATPDSAAAGEGHPSAAASTPEATPPQQPGPAAADPAPSTQPPAGTAQPGPEPETAPEPAPVAAPPAPEATPDPVPTPAPEATPAPAPAPEPGAALPAPPQPAAPAAPQPSPSPAAAPSAPAGPVATPATVAPPDAREIAESLTALLDWTGAGPSAHARAELPDGWLARYQAAAARCEGLDWAVLAGVGKVMSDHGREPGASGPMGLREPAWLLHRVDGGGDGALRLDDPDDAVHTAAQRLCAAGAGDGALVTALRIYEPRWDVVHRVLEHAARYREPLETLGAALGDADPAALLGNANLTLYAGGRDDLAAARVDPRVRQLLALLTTDHRLAVSAVQSGHSKYVAGTTSVSHHWHGRAVDISVIDGTAVGPGHATARALVTWLAGLPDGVRPDEVGSPFADLAGLPGFFTDADHQGHLHIGWRPAPIR